MDLLLSGQVQLADLEPYLYQELSEAQMQLVLNKLFYVREEDARIYASKLISENIQFLFDLKISDQQTLQELEIKKGDAQRIVYIWQSFSRKKLFRHIVTSNEYIPAQLKADEGVLKELEVYEERGQCCINDERENKSLCITNISNIVAKVYQQPPSNMPFLFLASSSGTGKTQLAFSIDQPIVYFLMTEISNESQKIYQAFDSQSRDFLALLDIDMGCYNDVLKLPANNFQPVTPSKYAFSTMYKQGSFVSLTAGFLVEFWKRVIEAKCEKPSLSWMRAQLECKPFTFQKKTISQAREELNLIKQECINRWSKPPVVFLDEADRAGSANFQFVRSLIRSLGLALIIVGTNTDAAADLVIQGSASRIGEQKFVWCYLVHQLPPISRSYFDKAYLHCENGIESTTQVISNKIGAIRPFVDLMISNILKERPLFAIRWTENLQAFLNQTLQDLQTANQYDSLVNERIHSFLESGTADVFLKFLDQKRVDDTSVFRQAQIDYLDPRAGEVSGCYVNKHIASIRINKDVRDDHIELFLRQIENGNVNIYYKTSRYDEEYFYGKSVMPEYDAQPLTGLCFTGPKNALLQVFGSPSRLTVLSANLMYQQAIEKLDQKSKKQPLERIVQQAIILASHANGIKSRSLFRDVFPHFVRELQSEYGDHVPTIDWRVDSEQWNMLDSEPIPYCASSDSNWDKEVFEYLTQNLGCHLGSAYRHTDTRCQDGGFNITVYRGNLETEVEYRDRYTMNASELDMLKQKMKVEQRNKEVLSIEAKMYQENIDGSVIHQIVINDDTNSKIRVVVGTHWSDFEIYKGNTETSLGADLRLKKIWLLKLIRLNDYSYEFEQLFRPDGEINKVYIIIELENHLMPKIYFDELLKYCRCDS